ncbi:MAG: hypothetical protein HXY53_09715 [Nitrospirae bacterium]|nr:hypothetical protein [Nitrospirota bacterium]
MILELNPIPWALFLEKYPSGEIYPVKDVIEIDGPFFNIATPDIRHYCESESCNGEQTFRYSGLKQSVNIGKKGDYILKYTCQNCEVSETILKVHLQISSLFGTNKAMKY